MTPQVTVEKAGAVWEIRCARCTDWKPDRELRLDAETLAQRHMDEHARQRRVA